MALEVRGLARRFGFRWALKGVTLEVDPGEALAVLGANGSGKTTLLRLISTALRPTAGDGRVYGYDLVADAPRVREVVGFFGYAPGLYDDLTAMENLVFSVRMAGLRPERRDLLTALERVGLEREADERAHFFSAGMRRRLALARLILRPPSLLLLDEPYANFDAEGMALVDGFVASVKAKGGAVVMATHDPIRSASVADRNVTLDAGRLVKAPVRGEAVAGSVASAAAGARA